MSLRSVCSRLHSLASAFTPPETLPFVPRMTALAASQPFQFQTETTPMPAMTPLFRTGQLIACSDFLSVVPRSAMIAAIVEHVTAARPISDGEAILSQHEHGDTRFCLLTTEDRTKTLIRLDDARVRLACSECDRQDKDGITPEQLAGCVAEGWTDICEVQTHEQSMTTYENPQDAPSDFDITAWHTHLGLCPDCQEE